MPDSPFALPAPTGLDFAELSERLVAHRLSRSDLAPLFDALTPAEARGRAERLVEAFRIHAGVFAGRSAIDNRVSAVELLGLLTAALADACGARSCRLVLADTQRGGFFAMRSDGSFGEEPHLPALRGISGQVLADGIGRSEADLADNPEFDLACDASAGAAVQNGLFVPLSRAGAATGVLQLFDKADGGFTDADRRLAETAAPYVAELAARAGRAGSEEGCSPFRLIDISAVTEDLSGRDLMLSKILAVAIDMLDADRAIIFLYDPTSDELYSRHAEGLGGRELRIDAGLGLVGAAFRSGEILNVADAYQDPRFHPGLDWQIGYRTRSLLCAPVFGNGDRRVGAVQMLNKRRGNFTAADERRLRGLASQMGITIDYGTLFEQTLSMKSYNESMLRSLSNGVVTAGLDGTVTFVNQAATRILRLDEAAVGRAVAELFAGLNAWVVEAIDDASAAGSEKLLANSEFYIEAEDDWIAANLTLVPLRDGKQTPLGTMLVIEDVQRERELRRTMSRYLSNEVIDRLMLDPSGGLGGSSQEVTILFSDIRGFTALAERLGAGETVSMLNEYFSFMEDVVTNRSGMIDKYIGDAIMALFGSPFPTANDAGNAVQAAIDMFQVLQILNARRRAENKAAIRIGVGIGTGVVVTGNIGSPKRMDFTVIGDPVNLAARIEAATKTYGADILVCGATWSRLAAPPRARRLDVVRLRGQRRPTDLWELLEHRADICDRAVEVYAQGLEAYLAGQWRPAAGCFEEAGALAPGDKAAALMAARCRGRLDNRPERWEGVTDLD